MNLYQHKVKNAEGKLVSIGDYKGKVLLIVNTATGCGFTPQYKGLQELYEKYQKSGFEILDFPCNQFGNQTPGSDKEITEFCQLKYQTTFQTFGKVNVNGKEAEPLFHYLKKQKHGLFSQSIKWNFTKFLMDREGNVIKRYAPTVAPSAIEKDINNLLA